MVPRVGDQLEFEGEGWLTAGVGHPLPWGGRSPRALTRGYERFTLKAQAAKARAILLPDENQYDLWVPIRRAPAIYAGAPLLLEPGG